MVYTGLLSAVVGTGDSGCLTWYFLGCVEGARLSGGQRQVALRGLFMAPSPSLRLCLCSCEWNERLAGQTWISHILRSPPCPCRHATCAGVLSSLTACNHHLAAQQLAAVSQHVAEHAPQHSDGTSMLWFLHAVARHLERGTASDAEPPPPPKGAGGEGADRAAARRRDAWVASREGRAVLRAAMPLIRRVRA